MEPTQPIHEPDHCINCESLAHRLAVIEWGDDYDVITVCKHHYAELVTEEFKQPFHAKRWSMTHSEVLPDYTDDGTLIPEHCFTDAPLSTENPMGVVLPVEVSA